MNAACCTMTHVRVSENSGRFALACAGYFRRMLGKAQEVRADLHWHVPATSGVCLARHKRSVSAMHIGKRGGPCGRVSLVFSRPFSVRERERETNRQTQTHGGLWCCLHGEVCQHHILCGFCWLICDVPEGATCGNNNFLSWPCLVGL